MNTTWFHLYFERKVELFSIIKNKSKIILIIFIFFFSFEFFQSFNFFFVRGAIAKNVGQVLSGLFLVGIKRSGTRRLGSERRSVRVFVGRNLRDFDGKRRRNVLNISKRNIRKGSVLVRVQRGKLKGRKALGKLQKLLRKGLKKNGVVKLDDVSAGLQRRNHFATKRRIGTKRRRKVCILLFFPFILVFRFVVGEERSERKRRKRRRRKLSVMKRKIDFGDIFKNGIVDRFERLIGIKVLQNAIKRMIRIGVQL